MLESIATVVLTVLVVFIATRNDNFTSQWVLVWAFPDSALSDETIVVVGVETNNTGASNRACLQRDGVAKAFRSKRLYRRTNK